MKNQIKQKEHFHGSDLEKIEQIYGIKKEEIISFSANVNPLGISPRLRETLSSHIDAITSYPDREYTSLRRAINQYTFADPDSIIVGNGSTELISLFISLLHPKQALLIEPTYSEYEREVCLNGGQCQFLFLKAENSFTLSLELLKQKLEHGIDLLILCNPNNPTSSVIFQETLIEILKFCQEASIYVLIDETYVEFTENIEEITAVPLVKQYKNLIVLRGVSKFFASPGLRLGYGICSNDFLLQEIKEHKNPWTINTLAVIAGELMFSDEEYIDRTRSLIAKERHRICSILQESGNYQVFPAYANFVLLRIKNPLMTSDQLFDAAIRQHLMIRDCSTFPSLDHSFIRFCFMLPEQNNRLMEILLK